MKNINVTIKAEHFIRLMNRSDLFELYKQENKKLEKENNELKKKIEEIENNFKKVEG